MGIFDVMLRAMGFEVEDAPPKSKQKKEKRSKKVKKEEIPTASFILQDSDNLGSRTAERTKKIVLTPVSQKDVFDIVDTLKYSEQVTVDLVNLSQADLVRSVDFLTGAVYALDGKISCREGTVYVLVRGL